MFQFCRALCTKTRGFLLLYHASLPSTLTATLTLSAATAPAKREQLKMPATAHFRLAGNPAKNMHLPFSRITREIMAGCTGNKRTRRALPFPFPFPFYLSFTFPFPFALSWSYNVDLSTLPALPSYDCFFPAEIPPFSEIVWLLDLGCNPLSTSTKKPTA